MHRCLCFARGVPCHVTACTIAYFLNCRIFGGVCAPFGYLVLGAVRCESISRTLLSLGMAEPSDTEVNGRINFTNDTAENSWLDASKSCSAEP